MSVFKELKEDFDRWWVTATFEEKVSVALIGAMIVQSITLPLVALLKPRNPNDR